MFSEINLRLYTLIRVQRRQLQKDRVLLGQIHMHLQILLGLQNIDVSHSLANLVISLIGDIIGGFLQHRLHVLPSVHVLNHPFVYLR